MVTIKFLPEVAEVGLEFANVILSAIAVGYCLAILAVSRGALSKALRYAAAGILIWGLAELIEGLTLVGLLKFGPTVTHAVYHGIQLVAFIFLLGSVLQVYHLGAQLSEER